MESLERHLAGEADWTRPAGGFFSWLTLREGMDSIELTRRGMEQGVAVVPGVPFYPDGRGGNNIRLSFSKADDEDIDEGIRRLIAAQGTA